MKAIIYNLVKTEKEVQSMEQFDKMMLHTTSEEGHPTTYINGGVIATRSIYANSIQVGAIQADHIRSGTIVSDHISSQGITADNIKGSQLQSMNPVSEGGSMIDLDNGSFIMAGGNISWNNETKAFTINATNIQIGNNPVLNTSTDLAKQINSGVTRIGGNALHFDSHVTMDTAFIEKLVAQSAFIEYLDSKEISADLIKSGTLEADHIKGGTLDFNLLHAENFSADNITTGKLDVSSGLKITSGNHQIMSIDPETLELEFNVSKMSIGGIKLISEDDQPQMEENIAKELEGKLKQYLHIAYADDASGNGFSFSPLNKPYIGMYSDHNKEPSEVKEKYQWIKIEGDTGKSSRTHIAYANRTDSLLTDFSLTDSNREYLGIYSNFSEEPPDNPEVYKWTKIKGEKGAPGNDGNDGIGILSTRIEYTNHTSGTDIPSEGWQETIPNPIEGQYQWTRTVVGYTEGKPSTSYSVSYIPTNGQRGPEGNGIESSHVTYAQSLSGTVKPIDWGNEIPDPEQGQYLWTKTVITYTDNSTSIAYSTAYNAKDGKPGKDGYTPIKGIDYFDGSDGISIVSVKEYYLVSDKDAGITITGYDWEETFQPISETKPYLWNYEKVEYSNGLSDTFGPNIIGHYATDGEKGETGRGIASIKEYYLASPDNSGVIVENNEEWSTTFQETTPTKRYLWNYEEITYTDGTKDIIGPSIIGTHGAKGDSPIVAYLTNDNHMIPTDSDGLYPNYDNAYTEMHVVDGIEDDTSSYDFSAEESSGIVGKIEDNKYTVTSLTSDIAEVKITATKDSFTISKVFTVTKSKQGIKGQDGQDSLIYQLETDSLVLKRDIDGTINPGSINIQAISMKGNDPKKPFACYFRIYEQHTSTFITNDFTKLALENGITEEEYIISLYDEPKIIRYESIVKESSLEYKPRADAISVYIQMFADDSFNEVLDSQTVVIVSDGKEGPKGEDAYRVEVLSRNGNAFKNGVIDTWLYAVVYKGDDDITDELEIGRFKWERVSSDPASDTLWNQRYFGGTKEIRITTDDVYKRATFTCSIKKQ